MNEKTIRNGVFRGLLSFASVYFGIIEIVKGNYLIGGFFVISTLVIIIYENI